MSVFAPPLTKQGNAIWAYLGYAQITSNSTTSSTTAAAGTNPLSVTVTVPAGVNNVRVSFYSAAASSAVVTTVYTLWDGTIGSGTQIQQGNQIAVGGFIYMAAIYTPSAGSHTYNMGFYTTNGVDAATVNAASTYPAYILVEYC